MHLLTLLALFWQQPTVSMYSLKGRYSHIYICVCVCGPPVVIVIVVVIVVVVVVVVASM